MSTTTNTVFSLEADKLRDDARRKRDALRSNYDRVLELDIERTEKRIELLDRQHAAAVKRQREADANRAQRQADERATLERRLMDEYIASSPGTTQAEATAALPDLLHRYRLAERDRMDAALADAKRRYRL